MLVGAAGFEQSRNQNGGCFLRPDRPLQLLRFPTGIPGPVVGPASTCSSSIAGCSSLPESIIKLDSSSQTEGRQIAKKIFRPDQFPGRSKNQVSCLEEV